MRVAASVFTPTIVARRHVIPPKRAAFRPVLLIGSGHRADDAFLQRKTLAPFLL
jgi:hypothetical protein